MTGLVPHSLLTSLTGRKLPAWLRALRSAAELCDVSSLVDGEASRENCLAGGVPSPSSVPADNRFAESIGGDLVSEHDPGGADFALSSRRLSASSSGYLRTLLAASVFAMATWLDGVWSSWKALCCILSGRCKCSCSWAGAGVDCGAPVVEDAGDGNLFCGAVRDFARPSTICGVSQGWGKQQPPIEIGVCDGRDDVHS